MSVKERVIEAVRELPDDVSLDDLIERLYFIYKIERGIAQADAGQKISLEEIRAEFGRCPE